MNEEKLPEVRQHLMAAPWDAATRVLRRYDAACVDYASYVPDARDVHQKWPKRLTRLLYPLPMLSLMIILILRRRPLERGIVSAMWLYVWYLLPYVLVSYTDRYGAALVGIKMLLVLYGIDTVMRWVGTLRARRTVVTNA